MNQLNTIPLPQSEHELTVVPTPARARRTFWHTSAPWWIAFVVTGAVAVVLLVR